MRFFWLGLASGCGLFEGVEQPYRFPPCHQLSEVDVEDPAQDVGFLAPLGDRLDAIVGAFAVEVTRKEPEEDLWSGTLTLTQRGGIVAIEQEDPPDPGPMPSDWCASRYRIPVTGALDLDGGVFHLQMPLELEVTDASPEVRGSVVYLEDEGVWRDVDQADLSTTLDLRYRLSNHLVDPQLVTMSVSFEDGVTPSGAVDFDGALDAPKDELDGTKVGWAALTF